MNIAIIGLGLIGGSLAKSIKANTTHQVWGMDQAPETLALAKDEGAIDAICRSSDLARADMTFVCLHPQGTIDFILQHQAYLNPQGLVLDVCGVKTVVVEAVAPVLAARGIAYLGTHPMAGREFSGYTYALADLFFGASMILTPMPETPGAQIAQAETLFGQIGFYAVVRATPEEHDRTIAFTSQLAHVVSSAYIKSPSLANESGFSAGSFRDLTRVAKLDEHLWSELFLMNKTALIAEIDELMTHLYAYRQVLVEEDRAQLIAMLKDGRERKEWSNQVSLAHLTAEK